MIVFCRARSLYLLAKPAELRAWIAATRETWSPANLEPALTKDEEAGGCAPTALSHRPLLLEFLTAETAG